MNLKKLSHGLFSISFILLFFLTSLIGVTIFWDAVQISNIFARVILTNLVLLGVILVDTLWILATIYEVKQFRKS